MHLMLPRTLEALVFADGTIVGQVALEKSINLVTSCLAVKPNRRSRQ
jgi:N-acetylglutamate synthase-like GNAT family acetyltransferase